MKMISAANRAGMLNGDRQHFVWIEAKHRLTRADVSVGLWTGILPEVFVIESENRTYQGGGSLVDVPDISAAEGLVVHEVSLGVSALTPTFSLASEAYDLRRARVSIHEGWTHPETGRLYDEPYRIHQGIVDRLTIPESENPVAIMDIVSKTEYFILRLADKKSDATQQLRTTATGVPDGFRRYASDAQGDWWGQNPPVTG